MNKDDIRKELQKIYEILGAIIKEIKKVKK